MSGGFYTPSGNGLPGPTGPTGPAGTGALPASWIDLSNSTVMGSNVLVADAGAGDTDNATALQNFYALLPTSGNRQAATAVFGMDAAGTGRYGFGSNVQFTGGKAVRFIGTGSSAAHDGLHMTGIVSLSNGITIFSVDGNGTLQQQGPSFENFYFGANSKTGCRGLWVHQSNRIHGTNLVFADLSVGMELDEGGFDCAWGNWLNIQAYACGTGALLTLCNHQTFYNFRAVACTSFGMDTGNCVSTVVNGMHLDTGTITATGLRHKGRACSFKGVCIETGNVAGISPIGVQIDGDGTTTHGNGNYVEIVEFSGGNNATHCVGLDFTTNTYNNTYDVCWQSENSDQPIVRNAVILSPSAGFASGEMPNRPRGGLLQGPAANKPTAVKLYNGQQYLGSDGARNLWVCDGTSWRLVGPTT